MTLTSERARLDGRVVATDLDRALELLAAAERARAEAAALVGALESTGLERFLGYVSWERLVADRTGCGNRSAFGLMPGGPPPRPETGGARANIDVVIDLHGLAEADGPIERLRAELTRGAPPSPGPASTGSSATPPSEHS